MEVVNKQSEKAISQPEVVPTETESVPGEKERADEVELIEDVGGEKRQRLLEKLTEELWTHYRKNVQDNDTFQAKMEIRRHLWAVTSEVSFVL